MVWAILSTLFCCLPLGIVAIINSAKVDGLWRSGDYEAAEEAAQNAKKYSRWAAIIGVVLLVVTIIFEVGILMLADSSENDSETVQLLDDSDASVDDIRTYIIEDIKASNEDCPFELEKGVMITNIRMSDNYVVYTAECDEDIINVGSLKVAKSNLKKTLLEAFTADDIDDVTKEFVKNLKIIGAGIIYNYVGDTSGKSCIVKIEPDEL